MKAWVLRDIGSIGMENSKIPAVGEGEALIRVRAAGICGSDIPRIYRTGAHVHPIILGHEFSGEVMTAASETTASKTAASETAGKWQGRRVGVFPLIPCGKCTPCRRQQYELCRDYSYLGSRRDGAFAEYVAAPVRNLIELPDIVSYEEGAMLEPMAVAVHAMRRVTINAGDTVAVYGLGTIGLLLAMFLSDALGDAERLLLIGNKDAQRRQAMKLGVPKERCCDSTVSDVNQWLMEHTDGNGADVSFECVGKEETFVQAVENAAVAGRIVLTGNPCARMGLDRDIYWKLLRNQITVTGTWNSSFSHTADDDWHYALERISRGRLSPKELITHRFPLEELERGLHIMRDKTEDYTKIMVTV
ncbi:MAG: galactitol-1-phosphate 5-dehydrogenase [Roseburia sp.]|nr:galactitol-1-phosphate 5-dehydrogenase [Roseburia sp.]